MFYYRTSDGTVSGGHGGSCDATGALGCGSSADRRGARVGDRRGARESAHGAVGPPRCSRTGAADHPRGGPRRAHRPHRVRCPGRDPRSGRIAPDGERRAAGRSLVGQDDPRAACRRGGPERRAHRRVAGPRPAVRPRGGRDPRHPPRMARRPHAQRSRGGPRAVGGAAHGANRRPAAGRPARGPGSRGPGREDRRPAESPDGPRPARRDVARRAGAHERRGAAGHRRRRGHRPSPGARAARLDPARARRRRPADRGDRRPQPVRTTGTLRRAPDPLRGGRLARRLPPP